MELNELRTRIDETDARLRALLAERMELSEAVGRYKRERGLPILHPDREREVLERNVGRMEPERFRPAYREIVNRIMQTSRDLQQAIVSPDEDERPSLDWARLLAHEEDPPEPVWGYQGIAGSYGQQALDRMIDTPDAPVKDHPTFHAAIDALTDGALTDVVLPVENSSTGGVRETEHLIASRGLFIAGEYVLPIDHALLGVPSADIQQIREVYSHHQALSQCERYIESRRLLAVPYYNTAMSARRVRELNDPRIGAIASVQAAREYGLTVLAENIGDNGTNFTRFVRVRRTPSIDKRCDKISIRLSVAHEVGSLHRIISIITENNLNMTRIESRPIHGRPWEYNFHIDFEGSLLDARVRDAMDEMMRHTTEFLFLGNYPKGAPHGD